MDPKPQVSESYLIENVQIWRASGIEPTQNLWIQNGKLRQIGPNTTVPAAGATGTVRIDGKGWVLMPAGIDAQVHLRVPGQKQKELPRTGLLAALRGGYAAVLTMPNTQPTIDNVDTLRAAREEVGPYERETGVQVFWTAAITRRLNSDEPTPYEPLAAAGVKAFTNDGLGVARDEVMDQAFAHLEKIGLPLLQHAEVAGHGGAMAPGPIQRQLQATPYDDAPEWKMVERDLHVLSKYPRARYHVLHVSSGKTLQLVRQAKQQGLRVSAEVTPHHLFFNTETMRAESSFKMNPPIRTPADQEALWQALANGDLDFVATDHAPHEKLVKDGAIDHAAFGTIGMETTIRVLLSGWREGRLSPGRLVEVFAKKPAEFLGLGEGFGDFQVGAPFHAVWVDVNAPARRVAEEEFSSLSKNSCFIGSELPGKVGGAFHENRIFHFV